MDTLIAPAETLSYTYDGALPKSATWGGEINGAVSVEYNNDLQVTSQSINKTNILNFQYDQDGLLTQVGDMSITREQKTGRISSTTLGNVTTNQSYNTLGELAGYQANYNSNPIFQTSYTRDSLGRITTLNETVQGQNKVMRYGYDIMGRLVQVWRNDTLTSVYTYDSNGNRIAHITPTSADSGMYDAQDRMLTYGNTKYFYSKNGELQKKIEDADTTCYTYDYFANLITVILPNKDRIDYIIDAKNRRIGEKINGTITKRWIYSGQLSPIAELDSVGNVVAQFVGNYIIKGGNIYQLITDHLGSVRLVVNVATGTVAQKLDYDEFGNVMCNSNPDFQPFGYAHGIYDTQTRLVRFGARDYEASIGRWTAKDAILFAGGETNLYSYASNDPINIIDLYGLFVNIPFVNGTIEKRLIASAKEKGVELSADAAEGLRQEMTMDELGVLGKDKLADEEANKKLDEEKATVLDNIKDRILKDEDDDYSPEVKEELKKVSEQLKAKSDTCKVK